MPEFSAYETRKRRLYVLLWIGCVLGGGTLALIFAFVSFQFFADSQYLDPAQWLGERIKNALGGFGAFTPAPVVETLANRYPYQTLAFVGAIAGAARWRRIAEWTYSRFLDTFNSDVLDPIVAPRGIGSEGLGGPPLPWVPPSGNSGRAAIWTQLQHWSITGATSSPAGVPSALASQPSFGWAVVVGRAGAGKSRLVEEFARARARRDLFGSTVPRPADWRSRAHRRMSTAAFRCGAYARRIRRRYAHEDPWDAGKVRPYALDQHRLQSWRPCRPTIVVLDDPHLEQSIQFLKILNDQASDLADPYRHPVRFLIVNQTVPADLGMTLDTRRNVWNSRLSAATNPPIVYPDAAGFSAQEARWLAYHVLGPTSLALSSERQFSAFLEITQGSPLMVEIGLHSLRRGMPLDAMSHESLLRDRAERVLTGLGTSGIEQPSHYKAIAAATLAGGGRRSVLEAAFGELPMRSLLARAFPLDLSVLEHTLPAVRPDMIGDAFVRATVAGLDRTASTRDVVRVAWNASPQGVLRSVIRMAGDRDELGEVLRQGPPADWSGNRLDLALTFAECAVRGHGDQSMAVALTVALDPVEAERAIGRLADLMGAPGARGGHGLVCYARALERALSDASVLSTAEGILAALHVSARALAWAGERGCNPSVGAHHEVSPVFVTLMARVRALVWPPHQTVPLRDALQVLEEAAWSARHLRHSTGADIVEAIAELPVHEPFVQRRLRVRVLAMRRDTQAAWISADEIERDAGETSSHTTRLTVARCWRDVAVVLGDAPNGTEAARAEQCAERIDALAVAFPEDREIQLERARAWCAVACAVGNIDSDSPVTRVERIVAILEEIADPFSLDREFHLVLAWGWASVASVRSRVPRGAQADLTQEAARHLDTIASPFVTDRDLAIARLAAWCSASHAFASVPSGAEAAHTEAIVCGRVEAIAALFADDRDFAVGRARAWRLVAEAFAGVPSGALAARSEAIAHDKVDTIAASFPDERDFALERARTWRLTAYAFASVPNGAQSARSEAIARDQVDALAARFPGDRGFALERALSWLWAALAFSQVPSGARATCAEAIARGPLKAIAASFPDDRDFAVPCAQAWRLVAKAFAGVPSGTHAAHSEAIARDEVDTIAASFPDDYHLALIRAMAWEHAAYAFGQVPNGVEAAHAETIARDQVNAIAVRFRGDRSFALECANAWRHVVYAFAHVPSGSQAARSEAIARDRIDAIVAPFSNDRELTLGRAQAWGFVAYAFSEVPNGAEAERSEAIARGQVDAIAGPFHNGRNFALERARAWRHAAYAFSNVPSGSKATRSEAIARDHIDAIAAPFPNDRDLTLERAQAWQFVARAFASVPSGVYADRSEAIARSQVDVIAAPFCDDRNFAFERVQAWRHAAYAFAVVPDGAHASRSEAIARDQIDAIVEPFPDDRELTLARAQAWLYSAHAFAQVPSGVEAARCKAIVRDQVDAIVAPFAGDREFALVRAQAWRRAAYAFADVPSGAEAARCEAIVRDQVDAIVAPFADDRKFALVRAQAWRRAAYAFADVPSGAEAARCEAIARDQIDAVAAPFGDDREFALERARAWRWVVYAYAASADLTAAQAALERMKYVASGFLEDPDFSEALSAARADLGGAK